MLDVKTPSLGSRCSSWWAASGLVPARPGRIPQRRPTRSQCGQPFQGLDGANSAPGACRVTGRHAEQLDGKMGKSRRRDRGEPGLPRKDAGQLVSRRGGHPRARHPFRRIRPVRVREYHRIEQIDDLVCGHVFRSMRHD